MWAYLDESAPSELLPGTYILAATTIEDGRRDEVRAAVRAMHGTSYPKLHWYDTPPKLRHKIVQSIAALPAEHVVVIRRGKPDEHPERQRRKCMERLLYELASVDQLVAEARQSKQDIRDVLFFDKHRSAGAVDHAMRLHHVRGADEPLLWIPDTVAGAVRYALTGTADYLNKFASRLRRVEFTL